MISGAFKRVTTRARSIAQKPETRFFVVYFGPADAQIDLEPMKFYRVVTPQPNDPSDHVRVIDESGED